MYVPLPPELSIHTSLHPKFKAAKKKGDKKCGRSGRVGEALVAPPRAEASMCVFVGLPPYMARRTVCLLGLECTLVQPCDLRRLSCRRKPHPHTLSNGRGCAQASIGCILSPLWPPSRVRARSSKSTTPFSVATTWQSMCPPTCSGVGIQGIHDGLGNQLSG